MAVESVTLSDRDQWLDRRRLGVGGSEAAVVLGMSPWGSRYDLWAKKSGMIPDPDIDTPVMRRGRRFEAVVIDAYTEEAEAAGFPNRRIEAEPPHTITFDSERPWQFCTLDARVWDPQQGAGLAQVKTSFAHLSHKWESDEGEGVVPVHYMVQCQHEMSASGLGWATVPVLFGLDDYRIFDVPRDDDLIDAMTEAEFEFMECVRKNIPPPVDGHEATTSALRDLYRRVRPTTITLPDEAAMWHEQYMQAKADLDDADERKREARNQLLALTGENGAAKIPGVEGYWRRNEIAPTEVPAQQKRGYVDFRHVKEKKKAANTNKVGAAEKSGAASVTAAPLSVDDIGV